MYGFYVTQANESIEFREISVKCYSNEGYFHL